MRLFFVFFFYLYSLNHEIFTQYQVEFALLMFDVMEIIAKVLPTPKSKFNQAEIYVHTLSQIFTILRRQNCGFFLAKINFLW